MEQERDQDLCCAITQVHTDAVEHVRAQLPRDETLYDLAELFKIFGDSTRVKILYALLESELCVCDIAKLHGCEPVGRLPSAAGAEGQQAGEIPPGGQDHLLLPGRRPRGKYFESRNGTY